MEVLVEVIEDPSKAGQLGGTEAWDRLADRLGEIKSSLAGVLTDLVDTAEALPDAPTDASWNIDSIGLEFTLGLVAESGILISKIGGSGSFKIKVELIRNGSPDG